MRQLLLGLLRYKQSVIDWLLFYAPLEGSKENRKCYMMIWNRPTTLNNIYRMRQNTIVLCPVKSVTLLLWFNHDYHALSNINTVMDQLYSTFTLVVKSCISHQQSKCPPPSLSLSLSLSLKSKHESLQWLYVCNPDRTMYPSRLRPQDFCYPLHLRAPSSLQYIVTPEYPQGYWVNPLLVKDRGARRGISYTLHAWPVMVVYPSIPCMRDKLCQHAT